MEESKSSEQPRCPCGFWGSTNTLGLCSQCYKAHVEKTSDALKSTPDHHMISPEKARQMKQSNHAHSLEAGSSQQPCSSKDLCANVNIEFTSDTASSSHIPEPNKCKGQGDNSLSIKPEQTKAQVTDSNSECATSSNKNSNSETGSDSKKEEVTSSQTVNSTAVCAETTGGETAEEAGDKEAGTPQKRGVKRELDTDESSMDSTPDKGPGQKNKKRCFHCKTKLELAQRQIGRCKCELHNCMFNHKEEGRREAREKMVKPTRHLGTSFKRLDSS